MFLNEPEIEKLIQITAKSEPKQSIEDVTAIIKWAHEVRVNNVILGMILDGIIQPRWKGDDLGLYITKEMREKLSVQYPGIFPPKAEDEEWPEVIDVKGLFG